MSTTALSTRGLRKLWQGDPCWKWAYLMYGHVQPIGYRNNFRYRHGWQLHLTPLHLERDGSSWEIGICLGKRTLFIKVHG